jgi:hypothetical protein
VCGDFLSSKHKNARYHRNGRFCYWVIGWGPITDFSLEEKNEN